MGTVIMLVSLSIAFYTDIKYLKIPNKLTGTGVILGLTYHGISGGWNGIYFSLTGLTVGFFMLLVLYLVRAVEAGDVKLFALIGALSGTEFALYSAMYSVIYAGLIGMVILLLRRNKTGSFPFMAAVMPGVLTAWFYSWI